MEVVDETMGSNDHSPIIKGRRTKRQRPSSPSSPPSLTMSTSSSNAGGSDEYRYISPTTSVEFAEEEEDMANCLILLAQGPNPKRNEIDHHERKFKDATTGASNGKSGSYVYECKTCNRCFPSFQALGGHRASHKKPKAAAVMDEKKAALVLYDDEIHFTTTTSPPRPNNNNNNSSSSNRTVSNIMKTNKIHECSICGSEFSSGQALGGHMRRHRTAMPTTTTTMNQILPETREEEKQRVPTHVLGLDLNLPAPEEDREQHNKFCFVSKQPPLIYSASALVDCHY